MALHYPKLEPVKIRNDSATQTFNLLTGPGTNQDTADSISPKVASGELRQRRKSTPTHNLCIKKQILILVLHAYTCIEAITPLYNFK